MIEYVLDTDTCIYWLKGKKEIRIKVNEIGAECLCMTIVTLAELNYGAYNSGKVSANIENIHKFVKKVRVLPFESDAAERFGKVKTELRRSGQIIQDFDILIASIVLSHGGVLVTNNVGHFKRITGLRYDNWLQE